MTQTSSASERCQRCGKGTMLTDNDTGEMFCSKCGFVATERVEQEGPEWRSFSKDDGQDRTRTGTPTSLAMHDMGLATIINKKILCYPKITSSYPKKQNLNIFHLKILRKCKNVLFVENW